MIRIILLRVSIKHTHTHTHRAIDGCNPSIVFMQKREVKGEEENDNDSDDEETIPFSLIYTLSSSKTCKNTFFRIFLSATTPIHVYLPLFLSFSLSLHTSIRYYQSQSV